MVTTLMTNSPRTQAKTQEPMLLGLKSRRTGLNFTVWLHPKTGSSNLFLEVTPDDNYDDPDRTVVLLEPDLIEPSGMLPSYVTLHLHEFVRLNMDVIEDFWNGTDLTSRQLTDRIVRISEAFN